MDKRYINRFGDFYRHRASLVWCMGSLAYCFEKKKELLSVPENLWSAILYQISDCVIDLYQFDLAMEERINNMERYFNDGRDVVNELVQNDSELKVKTDALYEYLWNVRGFTYEIIDLHGIPYTDRLSAEEQVEFENTF
ncbi:MAG: hypothetical protein J5965_11045, partial [Aeriscardovia sp.]|nr:hypothetical protein [Aeriscardovia sp.]